MSDVERTAWITVSHPGMSLNDTIGDMVRLRTMLKALHLEGWQAWIVTKEGHQIEHAAPASIAMNAPRSGGLKSIAKRIVPDRGWSTFKDLSYCVRNWTYYDYLSRVDLPRPDVLIDYNFYYNDAVRRYARQIGSRVFLNFESFVEDSMVHAGTSLLRPLGQRFERAKYRSVDGIWAVSEPLGKQLREYLDGDCPPIHVIPNAVETPPDTSQEEAERWRRALKLEGKLIVGFVGGLSAWYALDELITVCSNLRQRLPSLHLVIVGDGPERQRLEEQKRRLAADAWCTFVGRVPHEDVPGLIQCFDVGAVTNHKWWTSPLKLLEYGGQGVPSIAPSLPSVTSIATDHTVALFSPGDFEDFERKLTKLLFDSELRQHMGQQFAELVRTNYSIEAMRRRIRSALS